MEPRPQDFFGPEDYTGGDPQEDIDMIKEEQDRWDEEYRALPWWKRIFV